MKNLSKQELTSITGGGISAALLNAAVRAFSTIIDFGIKIGSSIRRGKTKNYC